MFSNCITPTASLFAYVMYSNIMPNVIISFRHGRFFSFAWYNPLLLQMCIDGYLSLCSTEMLYRTGILVFFIILVLVEVCILSHHHIYILMHLNNVISFLDRSNALIVLFLIVLLMLLIFLQCMLVWILYITILINFRLWKHVFLLLFNLVGKSTLTYFYVTFF